MWIDESNDALVQTLRTQDSRPLLDGLEVTGGGLNGQLVAAIGFAFMASPGGLPSVRRVRTNTQVRATLGSGAVALGVDTWDFSGTDFAGYNLANNEAAYYSSGIYAGPGADHITGIGGSFGGGQNGFDEPNTVDSATGLTPNGCHWGLFGDGSTNCTYSTLTQRSLPYPGGALVFGTFTNVGAGSAVSVNYTPVGAAPRNIQAALTDGAVSLLEHTVSTETDMALALQRALNTGRNVYVPQGSAYTIRTGVTMAPAGQQIFGDGVTKSRFLAGGDFNLSAPAVVTIPSSASENHAGMHNVGWVMGQPDTGRSGFIAYPVVIDARDVGRLMIGDIRIGGARRAVDLRGNTGGLIGGKWEIGAYELGIEIDGALDTIDFTSVHFWPFSLGTANQLAAYSDGGTVGLRLGRSEAFAFGLLKSFRARIQMPATANPAFGTVAQLHLDGRFARFEQDGGRMSVGSMYATSELAGDFFVYQTAGMFTCGSWWGEAPLTGTEPVFHCVGGAMTLTGGVSHLGSPNAPIARVAGAGATLNFSDNRLIGGAGTTRTAAFVQQSAGRLIASGNSLPDIGSGSGPGVSVATNDWHVVGPNAMVGWPYVLPATRTLGVYNVNTGTVQTA